MHSNMRNIHRFGSSCACAEYYPDICFPFIPSVVFNDSVCDSEDPDQTARMQAQSDLGLHCPHMPEDSFSRGVIHFIITLRNDLPSPLRPF